MLIFHEGDFQMRDACYAEGPIGGVVLEVMEYGRDLMPCPAVATLYSEDVKRLHGALGEWLRDRGLA